MHDCTSKVHGLAWAGFRVQRVVVAIETIQMRRLRSGRVLIYSIRLLTIRRREIRALGSLGPTPVALPNKEARTHGPRVYLPIPSVYEILLRLHDSAGLALVPNTDDFAPDLEVPALGGRGQGFEEGDGPLAIYDAAGVEFGDTWD